MTYTVKDISEEMRVSVGTVLTWINSGKLVAMNTTPQSRKPKWRIDDCDFESFKQSLKTVAPPKPKPRRKRSTVKNFFED